MREGGKVDEGNLKKLKPVQYLMIVTAIFYGSLVLFLRLNGNFSTNSLWPFIKFGCKWSLFAWIFYVGVIYGKKLSSELIEKSKMELKNLKDDLQNFKVQIDSLETEKIELQKNLNQQIERTTIIEAAFHEKIKKYKRTAAEANRDALKNFV
jgi:hypothetical protein